MNRREAMMFSGMALASRRAFAQAPQGARPQDADAPPGSPPTILLKDWRPKSIYKVTETLIAKAKFPVMDVHCHGARPIEDLDKWVKIMDAAGVEKTIIFTGVSTPGPFAERIKPYAKYPGRFDFWCSFNLDRVDEPGFGPAAVKALEDCHRLGARGVGEVTDKGRGIGAMGASAGDAMLAANARASGAVPRGAAKGPHADDPRMEALWNKCGQLGMPINMHVSDPVWAYQPMDVTNDGLMLGWTWRINVTPDMYGHDQLVDSLEKAAHNHPKTIFIACHLANLDYDLGRLGHMFDRNANLYADISARSAEIATIPRFANQFFQKYSDRCVYGTDNTYSPQMFGTTFRILESTDDHFYTGSFGLHWPLNGLGLPDDVLKKLYRDNMLTAYKKAQSNAA